MCVDFVSHSEHELWCAVQNGLTRNPSAIIWIPKSRPSRVAKNSTVDLFTGFESRPLVDFTESGGTVTHPESFGDFIARSTSRP